MRAGAAHWAVRGLSRSYNLVGATRAVARPSACFLIWAGEVLGPFAEGVRVTMAPSSAPFGGTFPLGGGRLGRAAQVCRPYGGYRSDRVVLVGAGPRPARGRPLAAHLIRLALLGTFP